MKRATILVLTLVLALGAGTVLAHGHGHHQGMKKGMSGCHGYDGGPGGPMMGALRRLDLTDAQQQKVQSIMETMRPKLEQQREAMQAVRKQLADLDPTTFDEAAVRKIAAGLAAPMQEMAVLHQQIRSKIYAILTPEQRQQLDEMRSEREQRRNCMRGCMHGKKRSNAPTAAN